jgi:hypothetical protein
VGGCPGDATESQCVEMRGRELQERQSTSDVTTQSSAGYKEKHRYGQDWKTITWCCHDFLVPKDFYIQEPTTYLGKISICSSQCWWCTEVWGRKTTTSIWDERILTRGEPPFYIPSPSTSPLSLQILLRVSTIDSLAWVILAFFSTHYDFGPHITTK